MAREKKNGFATRQAEIKKEKEDTMNYSAEVADGTVPEKKKYFRTTISLDMDQAKKLKLLAIQNETTMSGWIQDMIDQAPTPTL